jgi:hypothetical protein
VQQLAKGDGLAVVPGPLRYRRRRVEVEQALADGDADQRG